MISRLGVEDSNLISPKMSIPNKNKDSKNPNFRGGGLWGATLGLMQMCEKTPMINVAVIDLLSAILPRTFVESMTNWFAGFEAFRRESSGLIVNCMIPGFIACGGAFLLNNFIMPKGSNLATCWADSSLIDRTKEIYTHSSSKDKVSDTLRQLLENVEGIDGKNQVKFNDRSIISSKEMEEYVKKLKELTEKDMGIWDLQKETGKIAKDISSKTHVFENIKVAGEKEVKAGTLENLLRDTVKFFHEYGKANKGTTKVSMEDFAKQSKKLVRNKSILGLSIILPLAASMQFINRWITAKVSGVKGAPIYEDFAKDKDKKPQQQDKKGLLKQKIISMSSMIGVGLLSMMKVPRWEMFEFKNWFPTMDQARLISTTTFASRMAAAEDKNELAESTTRDIATFLSLYFLGDYAAKGAATVIEKKQGIRLLNDTKPIEKDATPLKKFWHWFKDVNLKSSEEVVSKTAEELKAKGLKPNKEQASKIEAEIKKAIDMRSACQAANLGVSLLLLGLVIPIFTRKNTKKKHAEEMKMNQTTSLSSSTKATTVGV